MPLQHGNAIKEGFQDLQLEPMNTHWNDTIVKHRNQDTCSAFRTKQERRLVDLYMVPPVWADPELWRERWADVTSGIEAKRMAMAVADDPLMQLSFAGGGGSTGSRSDANRASHRHPPATPSATTTVRAPKASPPPSDNARSRLAQTDQNWARPLAQTDQNWQPSFSASELVQAEPLTQNKTNHRRLLAAPVVKYQNADANTSSSCPGCGLPSEPTATQQRALAMLTHSSSAPVIRSRGRPRSDGRPALDTFYNFPAMHKRSVTGCGGCFGSRGWGGTNGLGGRQTYSLIRERTKPPIPAGTWRT